MQWVVTHALQDVTKTISLKTSFKVIQNLFFSRGGDKLLKSVTTSYNALQEVTKNRHWHYFQSCSRSLSSDRRGKAVIIRYNRLQCVTKCYKNNATQGLVEKLLKTSFFSKGEDKLF